MLHRFLTDLYKQCDILETDNMLEFIHDDYVLDYCYCGDESCSTVYLISDRLPELDDGEDEYVETYTSNKGLIVLHFYTDGRIVVEALENDNYPFKNEVVSVYNDGEDTFKYALESDLEEELQQERLDDIQKIVNEYFNVERNTLETIIVE